MNETIRDVTTSKLAYVTNRVWDVMPLVLITIGTVGNVVTIFILLRKKLRTSSSSVYLLALTVTDICILYFGLLRRWMVYTLDFDIRVEMGCGPHIWLLYTILGCSSWILVALTVERAVLVKFPVYAKDGFSRRSAFIVLAVLLVIMALFNMPYIPSYDVSETPSNSSSNQNISVDNMKCTRLPELVFLVDLWFWLDLSFTSLIPLVLMIIGNGCTGYELIRRQRRKELAHHHVQQKSIVKLLVFLCVMFAVTTLPIRITLCLVPVESSLWLNDGFRLWWAVANMIMYTNNTINFLLYCSFGTNFRSEFKAIFKGIMQMFRQQAATCSTRVVRANGFGNHGYETGDYEDTGRTNLEMSRTDTISDVT